MSATGVSKAALQATNVDWRDAAAQKALVKNRFAGMPWHVPELLRSLDDASDLYFDAISRVHVPRWSEGRVALLGDAAWGVTLGGMGVGTGLVGAYVLAGELAAVGGDAARAFQAYERRMRGYASAWQKGAHPGSFLAPVTARGLWFRNTLLAMRPVQWLMLRSTSSLATAPELPDYSRYAADTASPGTQRAQHPSGVRAELHWDGVVQDCKQGGPSGESGPTPRGQISGSDAPKPR